MQRFDDFRPSPRMELNLSSETTNESFWQTFSNFYQPIHVSLVVVICTLGIPGDLAFILVLTRKELYNATNFILITLSASQCCLLITYLYITIYKVVTDDYCINELRSYWWVFSLLLTVNLSVVFHTTAVFHVIAISVIRYVTIAFFAKRTTQQSWFTMRRAKMTSFSIYVTVVMICVPFYLNSEVAETDLPPNCYLKSPSFTAYQIAYSKFSRNTSLLAFNFWFFGTICKLVPCFLLLVMSFLIVLKLKELHKCSESLLKYGGVRTVRSYRRTTHLILVVMCLFVLIELPWGVLSMLSGLLGRGFSIKVYEPLGDPFEMLTVLYSSVNFVIFCLMSSQFRAVFGTLFGKYSCCNTDLSRFRGRDREFTEDRERTNNTQSRPLVEIGDTNEFNPLLESYKNMTPFDLENGSPNMNRRTASVDACQSTTKEVVMVTAV